MVLKIILSILALAAMIWVIYDVFTKNKKIKTEMKVLWTVLAIFFSIITAIVYYIMYKAKK